MQSKVNYTVVGLFVIVLVTCLFIAIIWLSSISHGKFYHTYLVYVHEDVTGLTTESPVRFNGVKVGYVESMSLDQENSKLVRITLRIEPEVAVTTSTYAMLNVQGLTGVVYVNLKSENEKAPLLTAQKGEPYPVIPSKPSFLMQLSTVLPEVTGDIQQLSASIAQVLDAKNRQAIQESLHNMATVTRALSDNSAEFTETLRSFHQAMANIAAASDHFPETMVALNKTLNSVNHLSEQMNQASESVSTTMKSGQLVIRNFSDQLMPSAQQALSNLAQATLGVHQLTAELQRDPSMFVRGRMPKSPGPGEQQ